MSKSNGLINELPLVSIVTPSYNQAKYLEEAIQSVHFQDYPNIEHVIIDGGSIDGSVELLKKYSAEYGEKLIWITQRDDGQTDALNKGFRMANGQIIGWLNADDLYKPYAVLTAVNMLQTYPDVMMVHGEGQYVDEGGKVMLSRKGGDVSLEQLICVDTIMSIATFWRSEVFEKIGYMNQSLNYVMDWEYWVRMGMAGLKIKYINGPVLAQSREHADSKTIQYKERFWQERFRVFDTIFKSPETPMNIKQIEKQAYSGVYISGSYYYLRNGRLWQAVNQFWKALKTSPRILLLYNPRLIFENLIQAIRSYFSIKRIRE